MKSLSIILIVGGACLLAPAIAPADDVEEARRIATQMIKSDAIRFLTDREFEVEGDAIEGKARAVDPEEHVKVEIKDLLLVPGHVTVKFKLDARFEFEGKLTADDNEIDVRATATISPEIDIEADYRFEDGQLWVEARLTDAEFAAKLLELEPDDLPGGKRAAEELIVKELERKKDDLIREVNDWVGEQTRR
jgi:hypothetical protein